MYAVRQHHLWVSGAEISWQMVHLLGHGQCNNCAVDNECTKISVMENILRVQTFPDLYGDHLEADTRVMLHAKQASNY